MSSEPLMLESAVIASPNQVSCALSDEALILSLADGEYYGLDPVGSRIWELLQEQRSVASIRDVLVAEFEVTPQRCEQDILRLLGELMEARLVRLVTHGAEPD